MSSEVQSVIFDRVGKNKFTMLQAMSWLNDNNLKPMKAPDKTKNTWRFRIKDPKKFKRFRIKSVKPGIKLVIGFKK